MNDRRRSQSLIVEELTVRYPTPSRLVEAVRGVSFDMAGEKLGIVGESGSGKTTVGRALLGLVPRPGEVTAKRISFGEIDLLRQARNRRPTQRLAMIMQDPKYSLNPVMTVGSQIAEAWRAQKGAGRREAKDKALAMLEAVHIREPQRVYECYPHQISGGMGQRVMIAMMLIGDPDLLIADEPTSALDVTVQLEVLRIMDELVEARGLALIFISHDLNLVASFCDRVLIMYAGRVIDRCSADDLHHSAHPYTQGLLAAMPAIGRPPGPLPVIERDPSWLA